MGRFLAAMLLTLSCFALVQCQVQYSFLRRFPSLTSFFQHCECRYGNWTEVVPLLRRAGLAERMRERTANPWSAFSTCYQRGEVYREWLRAVRRPS